MQARSRERLRQSAADRGSYRCDRHTTLHVDRSIAAAHGSVTDEPSAATALSWRMTADDAGPSADREAQSPDPAAEAAFSWAADSVEAAALCGDARLNDQVTRLYPHRAYTPAGWFT